MPDILKFKEMFNFMSIGMVICDTEGCFINVNESFCKIIGYTEKELLSMNFRDITYPEDLNENLEKDKLLFEGKINSFILEKRYVHKNKSIIWVKLNVSLILDSNEQATFLISTVEDITAQIVIANNLKKSTEQIVNILESISDAFVSFDTNLCYTYMNTKAGEIFGRNPKELIGKHIWTEFPEGVGQVFYHNYYKALETQQFMSFEEYYPPYDKWFENRLFPSPEGLSIFFSDITERRKTENSIKESEEKFQKVFMASPDAIIITSLVDGRFIDVNEKFLTMSKYNRDEVIGKSATEINIWNIPEERNKFVELLQRDGKARNFEAYFRSKEGKSGIVSLNAEIVNIKNEDCVLTQARDISELKKIEIQLKHNQTQLQALFDTSLDAITICDENGIFLTANKVLLERWGKTREELVGHSASEVLSPEIFKSRLERAQRVIATGNHEQFIDEYGNLAYEITISPIIENDGSIKTVAMFSRDISERKQAEKKLRLSEEKFATLFNSSPDAILLTRLSDRVIVDVNESACNIIGYTHSELIGESVFNEKFWANKNELQAYTTLLQKQKQIVNFEVQLRMKNGENKIGLISVDVILLHDEVFLLGIIRDITERKKNLEILLQKNKEYQALNEEYEVLNLELTESIEQIKKFNIELEQAKLKAEESDRLKTAFFQNMSHEIRTPLNAIIGFADLLTESADDKDKLEKYTTIIRQRGFDLLDIINDILEIAKIESGQLPIREEKYNIHQLLYEIEMFFVEYKKRLQKEHVNFYINIKNIPAHTTVKIDQGKLKQVLINLITNAFKFTNKGSIILECQGDNKNKLLFCVTDTGIGIPQNEQLKIFERFVQIKNNATLLYGGTGLGLSIVQGILNLVGGSISLKSEVDKGSAFTFTFPYTEIKDIPMPTIQTEENKIAEKDLRVLIVEDDTFNAFYIKELLLRSNYTIYETEFGKTAINIALHEKIDVILMDIRLPDINGFEAIREIKKQKPNIKILCQTAFASSEDKEKAIEAGCDGFIPKPFNKNKLFSAIEDLFVKNK